MSKRPNNIITIKTTKEARALLNQISTKDGRKMWKIVEDLIKNEFNKVCISEDK